MFQNKLKISGKKRVTPFLMVSGASCISINELFEIHFFGCNLSTELFQYSLLFILPFSAVSSSVRTVTYKLHVFIKDTHSSRDTKTEILSWVVSLLSEF